MCILRIKVDMFNITLICVHAPTDEKKKYFKDEFNYKIKLVLHYCTYSYIWLVTEVRFHSILYYWTVIEASRATVHSDNRLFQQQHFPWGAWLAQTFRGIRQHLKLHKLCLYSPFQSVIFHSSLVHSAQNTNLKKMLTSRNVKMREHHTTSRCNNAACNIATNSDWYF